MVKRTNLLCSFSENTFVMIIRKLIRRDNPSRGYPFSFVHQLLTIVRRAPTHFILNRAIQSSSVIFVTNWR